MAKSPVIYTSETNLSADGSTPAVDLSNAGSAFDIDLYFGTGVTFGAGTLKLQFSPDGTAWVDCVNGGGITSGTADTWKATYRVYGQGKYRWTLTGSTTPTLSVRWAVRQVRYDLVELMQLTANGSTLAFNVNDDNGEFGWSAQGTWGSGTLNLEVSPNGGVTWFKVGSALTADGVKHITANPHCLFRFTLAGATNPVLNIRLYA